MAEHPRNAQCATTRPSCRNASRKTYNRQKLSYRLTGAISAAKSQHERKARDCRRAWNAVQSEAVPASRFPTTPDQTAAV